MKPSQPKKSNPRKNSKSKKDRDEPKDELKKVGASVDAEREEKPVGGTKAGKRK